MNFDFNDLASLESFLKQTKLDAIVSCLPFYGSEKIAKLAAQFNLHYFDLTEDVKTTTEIKKIPLKEKAFVPQCGLAPGFISIIANHLIQEFLAQGNQIETVKLRVGALPANVSNALQYSLTWSTDGLINEYGNVCQAIENNQLVTLFPLEDLEEIKIDGLSYEAFNTSGGIGSLIQTYLGKVAQLNYKTIRYPGHCAKMKFLMNELNLNEDRETLKRILEKSLPKTYQDVVLVFVSVSGKKQNQLEEKNYVKKFYSQTLFDFKWSAIQLTTASSLCAIVDLVLQDPLHYQGHLKLEQFNLNDFLNNQFGKFFA